MTEYLVKMTDKVTGKVVYKTGHTKWGQHTLIAKRFGSAEYDVFDIELLSFGTLSHPNWNVAKAAIITHENAFRTVVPAKDPLFMIEDYFEREPGTMKISGVTELIFLKEGQTEGGLIHVFEKFIKSLAVTERDLMNSIKG